MSTQELEAAENSAAETQGEDPLEMKQLWDSVTEGTFDNLHLDMFFAVAFVLIGCFFVCFVYPAAVRMLDGATKFELTPEMQEELKELMQKKKRGELGTKSELLDQMMAHQEKRDAHETRLKQIKNEKGNTTKSANTDAALRLRTSAKSAKPQAAVD